jgi:hypothetical protein
MFFTHVTNPLLIDGADAISVTTGYALGEIDFHFFLFHRFSTPAAIKAPLKRLSSALPAENNGECLTTMRALHLFLLNTKTFYKTINIPFVPPQFVKELSCPFIGEKTI